MKTLYQLPLLSFALALFSFSIVSAQSPKRYKEMADKEFANLKYRSAASLYRMADTSSPDVISKLGQSYRLLKEYSAASHWFEKQYAFKNQPDQFYLDYASVLSNNQKYQQAGTLYRYYLEKHPGDFRAKNLVQNEKKLPDFYRDSLNWKISYLTINTDADEFAPTYMGKGIVFSSNRGRGWGANTVFGWTQSAFTDIYQVDDTAALTAISPKDYFSERSLKSHDLHQQRIGVSVNDTKVLGDLSVPKTLNNLGLTESPDPVHIFKGGLNTRFHDGPLSLTADEQDLFYTRNQRKTSNNDLAGGTFKLELYEGPADRGRWNLKSFPYNSPEYSIGHPAVNAEGTVLYFVSDMPGGYGGKDIYVCTRKDRESVWSKPANLGPLVNTEGDELFPFLADAQTLYFSSDGHSGLGGIDIFKVELKRNAPAGGPINMGYPMNSSKDDFGILTHDGHAGYFSSNRYGSDDLFKFIYSPILITLKGKVLKSSAGKTTLQNVLIIIKRGDQIDSLYTRSDGTFRKNLIPNADYQIHANKTGYQPFEMRLSTKGKSAATPIDTTFYLSSDDASNIALKDMKCEQLRVLLLIENIYYDLNRFNIREDAKPVVDKLLSLLNTYPQLRVLISSHTDNRASVQYNLVLSRKRSDAIAAYLTSHGISSSRISREGHGKSRPAYTCPDAKTCSEALQQLNRRSEFFILLGGRNVTVECRIKAGRE